MSNYAMLMEDWLRGCVHHDGRNGEVTLPCDEVLAIADYIESTRREKQTDTPTNTTTDLISRTDAIDAFDGVKVDEENCTEYDIGYNDGIDFAISRLSVLPSAQPVTTNETTLYEDGTLWVTVEDCEEVNRVIVDSNKALCRVFYMDAPRWIPCSERLPEEDNWTGKGVQFSNLVLVTLDNAEDEEKVVDLGYTVDGKWFIQCDARVKFIPDGWELVAWLPLPEPYKGVE